MRIHSRCLSALLSCALSVSLLAPMTPARAASDGSIRDLVDRVTVLTESVQAEPADDAALAELDEMQATLEEAVDAGEDTSVTETVTMIVTGGTINVRTGPGTEFPYLKFSELSKDAQNQVLKLWGAKMNGYVRGTVFTVTETKNGWGKSPSGWVSLEYCEKI